MKITNNGYFVSKQEWQKAYDKGDYFNSDKLRDDFEYFWHETFTPELVSGDLIRPALWSKKFKRRYLRDNPLITSETFDAQTALSIKLYDKLRSVLYFE